MGKAGQAMEASATAATAGMAVMVVRVRYSYRMLVAGLAMAAMAMAAKAMAAKVAKAMAAETPRRAESALASQNPHCRFAARSCRDPTVCWHSHTRSFIIITS